MKAWNVPYIALLLQLGFSYAYKVNVRDIPPNADVEGNGVWWGDDEPRDGFQCSKKAPLSLSADKSVGACCKPDTSLKGSKDTEWQCCGAGHDVSGNKDVGFMCCPDGTTFDGDVCKQPDTPKCDDGKVMLDGKCQCPDGQVQGPDGECKEPEPGLDQKCSSGLATGMCDQRTIHRFPFSILPKASKPLAKLIVNREVLSADRAKWPSIGIQQWPIFRTARRQIPLGRTWQIPALSRRAMQAWAPSQS